MAAALSARTKSTYASGVRAFQTFCVMHGLNFCFGPPPVPDEDFLTYFVCHCATHLKLTYSTIKSYLAGVRNLYVERGLGNPLTRLNGQPMLSLELVLRGIKKQCKPVTPKRLPVTCDVLNTLCQALNGQIFDMYTDLLMKAACCAAFFGFLRCGEFTTDQNTFNPETNLCLEDLRLSVKGDEAHLLLKTSKTDPFREGVIIPLHAMNHAICPVQAFKSFLPCRLQLSTLPGMPLFLLQDGNALSRHRFLGMFSTVCERSGINPAGYSGHSFRVGAATSAAASKVPDHLVQALGRWSSSCYKTYIRTSKANIKWAQLTMCSSLYNSGV